MALQERGRVIKNGTERIKIQTKLITMSNLKDLSIADLKTAFDFVQLFIEECKEKARKENINPERIPAYNEAKDRESRLYHELLNRTTFLE